MTATLTADKFAEAAAVLELSDNYRVLRRAVWRDRFLETMPANAKLGLYVDVETTGLDRELAEVIELAAVPFLFDPDRGQILQVLVERVQSYFEEPKGEVSPEITKITGIEPEMLLGQRIDDDRINSLVSDAALVIAHNAEFDRPILERRLPAFKEKYWACSYREVRWEGYGAVGAKLGNLMEHVCGEFYDAHRAIDDARAGVHVLAHQRQCELCLGTGTVVVAEDAPPGYPVDADEHPCEACVDGIRSPFSDLLQSARLPTLRVWALNSPFPTKEKLRARGYRWSPGERGQPKSWFKDVQTEAERGEEVMYLRDVIGCTQRIDRITAKDRYSERVA